MFFGETLVPHVKYTFFRKKNKKFYYFNNFNEEKIWETLNTQYLLFLYTVQQQFIKIV
jgi:hypothetical protein